MSMIYIPKGAAGEYADFAINIYTGCPHRCTYCYAPRILHMPRSTFHSEVFSRKDIVPKVRKEMATGKYEGKTIHLCFTCDPYPSGKDCTATREIIKSIKSNGAHVQILTKNPRAAMRDFDLLDAGDRYGVTLTATSEDLRKVIEPNAESEASRIYSLYYALSSGIGTWVSFEPVIKQSDTLDIIKLVAEKKIADVVYIGKINYAQPMEKMSWTKFVTRAESICRRNGQQYVIKHDLKANVEI